MMGLWYWRLGEQLTVLVRAEVANVSGVCGVTSCRDVDVRKTRAKDGAGTWTSHVLAFWSQFTVTVFSEPCSLPSTSNMPPRVWVIANKVSDRSGRLKEACAHLSRPSDIRLLRYGRRKEVPNGRDQLPHLLTI